MKSGHCWRPVHNCSLEDPLERHLVVAIEVSTVSGKWAVRFILECFLVDVYFYSIELF